MALSTIDSNSISGLGYGFKNRIINGGMAIDQRNNGAAVSMLTAGGNYYAVDRFFSEYRNSGNSATLQQVSDAPTGFTKSLKVTVNTGAAMASNDYLDFQNYIEGFNVADLAWGTSNAKTFTVSFWVKSSIAGSFGWGCWGGSSSRVYRTTYTINSANTWEYKTITVPGDTYVQAWNTTNGSGLSILWAIALGTYVDASPATANQWVSGSWGVISTASKAHLSTSGSTFQITGVQLENGAVATDFDWRPYTTELALCQRYYQKLGNAEYIALGSGFQQSTTISLFCINYAATMRAAPSLSFSSLISTDRTGFDASITGVTAASSGLTSAYVGFSTASAGSAYHPVFLSVAGGSTGSLQLSSEL